MKNKELIEILMNMDLEKEVRVVKSCMLTIITKNDITETDKEVRINGY